MSVTSDIRNPGSALASGTELLQASADAAPFLVRISTPDGHCTWVNKAWLAFTGKALTLELGGGCTENIHPDDLARYSSEQLARSLAREAFQCEYRLRRQDGQYRWMLEHSTPLFDAGACRGYFSTCLDI